MRSSTQHFECDRCHDKCDGSDMIGLAGICLTFHDTSADPNDYSAGFQPRPSRNRAEREWCRKCRVEVGLLVPRKQDNPSKIESDAAPVVAPPATFEDLLREIIREEIDNAQQLFP